MLIKCFAHICYNEQLKTMKHFYFIIFLFLFSGSYAQESSNKFSLELFNHQNIDKTLTPLVNSGPGLRIGYTKEILRDGDLKSFAITGAFAIPKSDIEKSRKSIIGSLKASFDQQKQIKKSDFFIGYTALISYRDGFYKTIDQSHLYWANFFGGGLSTSYRKVLNPSSKINVSFKLPLIGVVSRSYNDRLYKVENPSFGNILKLNHNNLKFGHVGNYFQPSAEIEYSRILSKKHTIGLFFRSEYLSTETTGSLAYKELQNGLGIRFTSTKY